ncbi:uncharacterized protein LOC142768909 [Rhipicephalus microplus]|uniref:uncharacterized protein LOC142768909 n=1 Tax=Rhipicephalus microplus TaxID=6941 RepID=UPI003F6C7CFE
MDRPPSDEHAQPSQVSAVENSDIIDELRSTGGQGANQVEKAGEVCPDASRRKDPRLFHTEGKDQTDPTPEGPATSSSSKLGSELASCLQVLVGKNILRHASEAEPTKDEIPSQRVDDPAQAGFHRSVAEQHSTERSNSDDNSGTTLTSAQAAGTDSYTGDQALEKTATAESQLDEKQSEVHGRWSSWSQYIPHELGMPVRQKSPPEDVGPPLSHTTVAQKLLQIFRETQDTTKNTVEKSSEGSSAVMVQILPQLRAPETHTLRECEEELAMSAVATTSQDSENVPSQTRTGSGTKQLTEIMQAGASTLTDGGVKPSRCTSESPGDSESTTSLSAARTSVECKGESVSSSPAATEVHQRKSPLPDTVPQDSQDRQPQQRTIVPTDLLALSPQMAAMLPDYHHGISKRFHVGKSPLTLNQQSTYRNTISSLIMQPRASAFSVVRKVLHENKPIPLALPPTSPQKVGDKHPEPTGKSEHTVGRKLDFSLDTSANKNQAPASSTDATDEVSQVQLPAYKTRSDEITRAGEPSEASGERVSSTQDHFRECFFRAIELAPVYGTSGTKLWRPKPLRVPLIAQTVTTSIPIASDASKPPELATEILTSASSPLPGTTSAGNRDSPGSNVNMSSLSLNSGDIKHRPEIEETSAVSESDMPKNTEGKRDVTKAESGDTLSESVLHDSKALDGQPGCNEAKRSDASSQSEIDGQKTSDSRPEGTDSAREDCHRAVDSGKSNSPDDRLESNNASASDLDVPAAVDEACKGTTTEPKDLLL